MRKNAFTLAEVLITLTIIGIIAAITIPNLMQKWRKHERITQIKAAYSLTQNIIKSAVAENGDTYTWDFDGGGIFAQKYVIPNIKYQYLCGRSYTTESGKKCFNNGLWNWLNDSPAVASNAYGGDRYYKIKLQNGMDLGIWASPKVNGEFGMYGFYAVFLFDVDGASKGTTTVGEDLFAFMLDNNTGKIETYCSSSYNQCNNSVQNMLNNTYNWACNKSANSYSGLSCARVIERNGWEFPENYPVKKF